MCTNTHSTDIDADVLEPPLVSLPSYLAAMCAVAGTNDCIEQQGGLVRAVYRLRFRTAPCSTQRAVQHVGQMLDSIATLAPGAHAVVVTLPPITEQRQHPAFVRAAELSAALRNLLVARCQMPPAAALADFHAACIARLDIAVPNHMQQQKQQGKPSNDADVATAPLQGEPLALPMIVLVKLRTLLERWLRRRWDTISASRGLLLLTDNIHINDATAELLADLVAAALPASIREAHANSQHDK
jgi:lysophospholipase L1-like esterase